MTLIGRLFITACSNLVAKNGMCLSNQIVA